MRFQRRFCAISIRTSNGITDGLVLDEGPSVGTDDSPGLADGREDELDKRGVPVNAGVACRSDRTRTLVNYAHDKTAHAKQILDRIDGVGCRRWLRISPVGSVVVGTGMAGGLLVAGDIATGGCDPRATLGSPSHHAGGEPGQGGEGDGGVRVRRFA